MNMPSSSNGDHLRPRKTARRFLIVDDQPTMRRILDNVLQQFGYAPSVGAVNGNEALQKLATNPVDAIITDWQMPGMNGLDFIKALRANPETSQLPILVVTAMAGRISHSRIVTRLARASAGLTVQRQTASARAVHPDGTARPAR